MHRNQNRIVTRLIDINPTINVFILIIFDNFYLSMLSIFSCIAGVSLSLLTK